MSEKSDTLLDYFILPLVEVKRESFENFKRTLISKDGSICYIELGSLDGKSHSKYFLREIMTDKGSFSIYKIPREFVPDVKLMIEGKYSKISDKVKNLIKLKSGLLYNYKTKTGKILTSKAILALDKDPILIKHYKQVLNISDSEALEVFTKDSELLSKFNESDFIESFLHEESI